MLIFLNNIKNLLYKKHKILLIRNFFLIIINTFLETLSIAMVIPVLTIILSPKEYKNYFFFNYIPEKFLVTNYNLIFITLGIMIILFIIKFFFNVFLNYQQSYFHFLLKVDLSKKLLQTYLFQNYNFFLNRNSSELFRNIENELSQFTTAVYTFLKLLTDFLIILSLIALLIYIQPFNAIINLILIIISFFIFYLIFNEKFRKWGQERQYHDGKKIKSIRENFDGIKEIKLFSKEDFFSENYYFHNFNSSIKYVYISIVSSLIKPWGELTILFVLFIIITFSYSSNLSNVEIIKTLGLYAAVALRLMPSANQILNNINSLKFASASINVLNKEFALDKNINKSNFKKIDDKSHVFKKSISLKNINFKYSNRKNFVLRNFSIDINYGEILGIVGESGSGKSTLLDIIMSLQIPTEGNLFLDNIKIDSSNDFFYKKLIGYVPQNIYLLDDTIEKNICFGSKKKIDKSRLNYCIEKTKLNKFLKQLPEGINTKIGERGLQISGGQKQRLGIARALYRSPKILILDESTNALDKETELNILNNLLELKTEMTIIIVAHRDSSIKICDRIIDLDKYK